jgi:general secretion pathway protein G
MQKHECENGDFRDTRKKTGGNRKSLLPLRSQNQGFTLIELVTVVILMGFLALMAFFAYRKYVYKAQVITAVSDIAAMEKVIYGYTIDYSGDYPPDLSAVDYGGLKDPWGNVYVYQLDLTLAPRTKGGVNINTDYDLYSLGRDGTSAPDVTAPVSLDDVIRAEDGQYKGRAEQY